MNEPAGHGDVQERPRKIWTFDDLMAGISDMAENGTGAQKAAAYRMLMSAHGGTTQPIMGEPLLEKDLMERLSRLMKASGKTVCQVAFGRAFPLAKGHLDDVPTYEIDHIDYKNVKLPMTLKQLYRQFPEVKRPGFPPGYPQSRGLAMKTAWCQQKAKEIIRDRKQKAEEVGRQAEEEKNRPDAPETAVFPRIGSPNEEKELLAKETADI